MEKGESFNFSHSLVCLLYSIDHQYPYTLSLSFQLADLLPLFIVNKNRPIYFANDNVKLKVDTTARD